MKSARKLIAVLVLTAGCGPTQPAGAPDEDPAPARRSAPGDPAALDALVRQALAAWEVPGVAVAVVRGEEVVYLKGHGLRDLDTRERMTPDTVFPIASCTKAFTTTAMAMLVDEGKMAWDDPVRRHIDFFRLADPEADARVTLRDLVTHRVGLRGHELLWYRSPWKQEEIIRRIGRVPLDFPFRSKFHYQTTMFQAAGYAVGQTSGDGWAAFVRERIVEPLGLRSVSFTTVEAEKSADRASPHRTDAEGALEVIPWYRIEEPDPAGSINASAADLARWLMLHLQQGVYRGRRLVSAANLAETHSPQTPIPLEGVTKAMNPDTRELSYGMGWVVQDHRGHRLVSHGGAIDGFRAHLTLVPEEKLGIVLLCNRHETRMNLALSNTLLDHLLGLPRRDWHAYLRQVARTEEGTARARAARIEAGRQPGTRPSLPLSAYAGSYEHPAYGTARVTLKDGTLVWHWSTFEAPLQHFHHDTFTLDHDLLRRAQVTFTPGPDGQATAMNVAEPVGVTFERSPPVVR